jgi:hypothetical protein
MTVSSTTSKVSYSGNGTTVAFAVSFYFLADSQLTVTLRAADGSESTKVLNTDYTVSGAGVLAGGTVTMTVAPASGTTLVISRNVPLTQETDLQPNDRLPAETLEQSIDKLTMIDQQLQEEVNRTIKFPVSDSASLNSTLVTAANRANKYLKFNASGEPEVTAGPPESFVSVDEVQYATAGQTVFTLTTITYVPGTNNLTVFVDGVNQYRGIAYQETNSTTVTFTEGLHVGAEVKFTTVRDITNTISDAATSTYLPAGSGAVQTNVQTKLRELVSVEDFGAVGDGVVDDTLALRAAFAYAIPLGKTVVLKGTYRISEYIGLSATIPSGALHIYCDGSVTIQVSTAATAFRQVLFFGTTEFTYASITGGSLTINCANKAASGIEIYTASATVAGAVNLSAIVTVNDCRANDPAATYENGGILVNGQFDQIYMNSPRVENVFRANTSGGACFGITVINLAGECLIVNPAIKNVFVPDVATSVDADGIKIFGVNNAASPAVKTLGKATIQGGTFTDCQGRSIKLQCSDVTIIAPYFKRQFVVSIPNGLDVDFQSGNGLLIEPTFEYKRNGAVSPLGASFIPVAFQQRISDLPQCGKSIGGTMKTEVDMNRYALLVQLSTSAYSETVIDGLSVEPTGTLTTTAFTRGILETNIETANAKTAGTKIVVRRVSGPLNCYAIGYTGYTSGSLANKLEYEVTDLSNTLAATTANFLFYNLSGNRVGEVKSFVVRDNANFRDLLYDTAFDFNNLASGSKFTVLTNFVTAANAPSWASGRYAFIEVLGGPNDIAPLTPTNRNIRVTVTNAGTGVLEEAYITADGGTTWNDNIFGTVSGNVKTVTGILDVDGQLQLGGTIADLTKFSISGTLPSDSGTTYGIQNRGTIPSTSSSSYIAYQTGASTQDAAFTLGSYIHYWASQGVLAGGSRLTPTVQYGFAVNSNLVDATTNYGFYSNIPAGLNRWNFVANGTARNYFAGGLEVAAGSTTMSSGFINIPAAAGAPTGAPTNPSGNVPLYYDSTNHKIYVYSGGTWRSTAALT